MQQRRRDLVPLVVRNALRDMVGGWGPYSVGQIAELFEVEGFSRAAEYAPSSSGARRDEADAFHAPTDLSSPEQLKAHLRTG